MKRGISASDDATEFVYVVVGIVILAITAIFVN
jgi:hypothetical protein